MQALAGVAPEGALLRPTAYRQAKPLLDRCPVPAGRWKPPVRFERPMVRGSWGRHNRSGRDGSKASTERVLDEEPPRGAETQPAESVQPEVDVNPVGPRQARPESSLVGAESDTRPEPPPAELDDAAVDDRTQALQPTPLVDPSPEATESVVPSEGPPSSRRQPSEPTASAATGLDAILRPLSARSLELSGPSPQAPGAVELPLTSEDLTPRSEVVEKAGEAPIEDETAGAEESPGRLQPVESPRVEASAKEARPRPTSPEAGKLVPRERRRDALFESDDGDVHPTDQPESPRPTPLPRAPRKERAIVVDVGRLVVELVPEESNLDVSVDKSTRSQGSSIQPRDLFGHRNSDTPRGDS